MTADAELIARWADRLRRETPGAVAVLLKGSHARGDAGPSSDIDFDVLTDVDGDDRYPVYIEEVDGRLRHVSVAVEEVGAWLAGAEEPASWSFRLPAAEATRLLWCADPALVPRLGRPAIVHPPGEPEVEDTVEAVGKMRNAHARGDDLGLRLAAQVVGDGAPGLLRLVNPPVRPGSRREALVAALDFPVAPAGYREDLLACLGLHASPYDADALLAAAVRLIGGTLDLLAAHPDALGEIADDLRALILDGSLRRLVGS